MTDTTDFISFDLSHFLLFDFSLIALWVTHLHFLSISEPQLWSVWATPSCITTHWLSHPNVHCGHFELCWAWGLWFGHLWALWVFLILKHLNGHGTGNRCQLAVQSWQCKIVKCYRWWALPAEWQSKGKKTCLSAWLYKTHSLDLSFYTHCCRPLFTLRACVGKMRAFYGLSQCVNAELLMDECVSTDSLFSSHSFLSCNMLAL